MTAQSSKVKRIFESLSGKELTYKGYTGIIEYSELDDCLFGKVIVPIESKPKQIHIMYDGNSLEEFEKDFREFVDFYIECKEKEENNEASN